MIDVTHNGHNRRTRCRIANYLTFCGEQFLVNVRRIDRHGDVSRFRDDGEVRAEVSLRCPVWKVADEQTDCQ